MKLYIDFKILCEPKTGFIRVREMSGKFKFFQGQGIVREFYVVSGKNVYFLKCQGILKFPVDIK